MFFLFFLGLVCWFCFFFCTAVLTGRILDEWKDMFGLPPAANISKVNMLSHFDSLESPFLLLALEVVAFAEVNKTSK